MIAYDPSEGRVGTALPPKILEVGYPLPGLEKATGADLFIDRDDRPFTLDLETPFGMTIFQQHLKGGMLVQRKTGLDALSSIPEYRNILGRMYETGSMSWLLVVGVYWSDSAGNVVFGGHGAGAHMTQWKWHSYQGALDAWQIRGGYVHVCEDDFDAVNWLLAWDRKVKEMDLGREQVIVKRPTAPSAVVMHPKPWIATLESFPGVGPAMADAISDYTDTLAHALMWLSGECKGVPGVGPKTRAGWRRWMGLNDGESLVVHMGDGDGNTDA